MDKIMLITSHSWYKCLMLMLMLMVSPAYPFAAWLVERKASCFLNLRDPTEVIMNNYVVPVDKSSHNDDIFIKVLDKSSGTEVPTTKEDDVYVIYVKKNESIQLTLNFILQLQITNDNIKDLQYVMDVATLPEPEDDDNDETNQIEKLITGKFTSSSSGCEGRRLHGRQGDQGLDFELTVHSGVFALSEISRQEVGVVAGWAIGHEAVTLTNSIVFRPVFDDSTVNKNDGRVTTNLIENQSHRINEPSTHIHKQGNEKLEKYLNFRKKYEQEEFGKSSFTLKSYLQGVILLLLCSLSFIQYVKSSNTKRDRDRKRNR